MVGHQDRQSAPLNLKKVEVVPTKDEENMVEMRSTVVAEEAFLVEMRDREEPLEDVLV